MGDPKCWVSAASTWGASSTQRSRCATLGRANWAPAWSAATKWPPLYRALARAGRLRRMPSPQAWERLSRSMATLGLAAATVDGVASVAAMAAAGGSASAGPAVIAGSDPGSGPVLWRRRTAPSDGRRPTSPVGSGVSDCSTAALAAAGAGLSGAPDDNARSRAATRSVNASIPASRSGRAARTSAISRTTWGSGASRMSTSACPSTSMARTRRGIPIDSANVVN